MKIEKEKKESKPDQKKQETKKDTKTEKKAEPKKEVKKEEAPVVPQADPAKAWVANLPELSFSFYDFKTELVNAPDKTVVLENLFKTFDDKGLSIWLCQYEKLPTEG